MTDHSFDHKAPKAKILLSNTACLELKCSCVEFLFLGDSQMAFKTSIDQEDLHSQYPGIYLYCSKMDEIHEDELTELQFRNHPT
jgi:hypothetical protein